MGTPEATLGATAVEGFERMLPDGERVLWSGAPDAMAWLRRSWVFRGIWLWVGALAVFSVTQRGGIFVPELSWIFTIGGVGSLFVAGFVFWTSRSTRYLITDRRIAMAIGLALPGEANIPLGLLENAAVRRHGDGSGDIALLPEASVGAGYLILWPHVRPWRLSRPEPTLRALADVDAAAEALRSAVEPGGPARSADHETEEASAAHRANRDVRSATPPGLDDVA